MAEFVLKNNHFQCNLNVKHQISGTAIGTKFATPFACMYMDYMENQFLKKEKIQSWICFKYLDDIFFIWTASEKELDNFLEQLNNFYPNLKFTHERSREEINFLDVIVRVNQGEIITNLYCKPTDGHQYRHIKSYHPGHTKSSIIFSQALRMRRIYSKKSDLVTNVRKLTNWLKERGYPEDMVNKETKRALESPSLGRSKTSERSVSGNGGTGVPLVVNYNSILCRLGQVIRKNLCFLYQDEEVKQVFNPAPFVSFRSVRALRRHLVRAKVYPVGERLVGSRKCNKNSCQVSKNVIETETFQSFVDKKGYKINHRFTCRDKSLVYLLSCKYVVCNITVKLTINSDTSGIIIR